MKLVKKQIEYTTKNGEKKKAYNFYLVFDNGYKVAVKNVYQNDYASLKILAENE